MTLVKWIVYQVRAEQRAAFAEAQQQWGRLAEAAGFLGQVGGWNQRDPAQACILAVWQDVAAYRHFIELQAGLRLALWPRPSIAHDTGVALASPNATEFTLGHNVASKAAVDAVMAQATAAGATIVKAAHETFWGGYSGYFQDPDGHLWEVVWNPQWSEAA